MNAGLDLSGASVLIALMAIEAACLILLAALVQRWMKSVAWQRTVWQACVVGILVLTLVEFSGAGRRLVASFRTSDSGGHPLTTADDETGFGAPQSAMPGPKFSSEFRDQVMQRVHENRLMDSPGSSASAAGNPAALVVPPLEGVAAGFAPQPSKVSDAGSRSAPSAGFWFVLAWLTGIGVGITRICVAHLATMLLRQRQTSSDCSELDLRAERLARRIGLHSAVRLIHSRRLTVPVAFGFWRSTIGLPADFERRFSARQQDAILAHEIAHLAARDPLWHLLADFAVALLWWHPLVWWTRRRLHAASELAADEASLLVRDGPGALAECLFEVGKKLKGRPFWAAANMGGFHSGLGRRVERLLRLRECSWTPQHPLGPALARTLCPIALIPVILFGTASVAPSTINHGGTMNLLKNTWTQSLAALALLTAAESYSNTTVEGGAIRSGDDVYASTSAAGEASDIDDFFPSGGFVSLESSTASSGVSVASSMNELGTAVGTTLEATVAEPASVGSAESSAAGYGEQPGGATRLHRIVSKAGDLQETESFQRMVEAHLQVAHENLRELRSQFTDSNPRIQAAQARIAALEAAVGEPASIGGAGSSAEGYGVKPGVTTRLQRTLSKAGDHQGNDIQRRVESKLQEIVFEEIYFDGLPLSEVLRILDEQTRKLDPDQQGLNFLINPNAPRAPSTPAIDPTTGLPLPGLPWEPVDMSSIAIKFNLPLRNVRLKDLLDAVVKVAEEPIRYSVEEYGVVFSNAEFSAPDFAWAPKQAAAPLEVRTFRVDPETFLAGLESTFGVKTGQETDSSGPIREVLREVFAQLGIDMNGKAVFYNPLAGVIMVRATGADLEIVRAAIQTLGGDEGRATGGGKMDGDGYGYSGRSAFR